MHGRIYYDTCDDTLASHHHLAALTCVRQRLSQTGDGDRIKTALHLQQCTYKNNVHFLFDKLSR